MIEITAEIRALIDKAAAGVELAGDEYIAVSYTHLRKHLRRWMPVLSLKRSLGRFLPKV